MAIEKLIPKIYDPHQVEEKWYDYWVRNNYFHAEPEDGETLLYCDSSS